MQESIQSPDGEAAALTVAGAIANLQHEDLSLRYYAAWWLGKFQVRDPAAIDALILALEDESDRTELGGYPLRRNAARALGKLGDRRAVSGLIKCLDCADFYVREAAAQSLGMLGDPAAIPVLMNLIAGGLAAGERVFGRPHLVQPCEAIIEALGALQAQSAVNLIQPFLTHNVERVKYAAARAMYQLAEDPIYAQLLVEALASPDVNLRRGALSDLGAIGYLPAANAIAQATVENSFKLFSLKGVLQKQLHPNRELSADAMRVMELMDALL